MPAKLQSVDRVLAKRFAELYPDEVALMLEGLPPDEGSAILSVLAAADSARVFRRLRPDTAEELLEVVTDGTFRRIVSGMEPGSLAATLSRLEQDRRSTLLSALEEDSAKELTQLMSFPSDSAGSIMDPRVATFRPNATVNEAVKRLRKFRRRRITDIFVIDDDGHLIGAVPLQALVSARPSDNLRELIRMPLASVRSTAAREEVLEVLHLSKAASLAVTDFDGKLIGVIRQDALMAAAQVEATADVQTMVGASKDERALSKVSFAVRRRLPWLQVNLGTAFLAAAVVGLFEDTIAQFTALAVLLPVVAGQSGNTGSQALAVTMRGLALREIRPHHWLRVTAKEVAASAINGLAVALVTAIAVFFWSHSAGLAGVIAVAMVVSMAMAGLAGASIPIVLERLGQDPAQASSIVLTTVTDVVGFMTFLGLATLVSGIL